MRFAAISDIHGNSAALRAVLDDIAALDIHRVVNLGDHLSGPLDPRGTAEILMASGMTSIRGDQDRILTELNADSAASLKRSDYLQLEKDIWIGSRAFPQAVIWKGTFSFATEPRGATPATGWSDRPVKASCARPASNRLKKTQGALTLRFSSADIRTFRASAACRMVP